MKKLYLMLLLTIATYPLIEIQAQNLTQKFTDLQSNERVQHVVAHQKTGTPQEITLSQSDTPINVTLEIKDLLKMGENSEIKYTKTNALTDKLSVQRFQQYFKGIKVEYGNYLAISENEMPRMYRGNYYDLDTKSPDITPTIAESDALENALNLFDADTYIWEQIGEYLRSLGPIGPNVATHIDEAYAEHYPNGELVLVDNIYTEEVDVDLAYKFNIYSVSPTNRRDYVYVNAHNGEIMVVNPIIKHVSTSVDTRYSGTQEMEVMKVAMEYGAASSTTAELNPKKDMTLMPDELLNSTTDVQSSFFLLFPNEPDTVHVLVDTTRSNGLGTRIETYDCNGVGGDPLGVTPIYGQARSFTDIDNDWTTAEHVRGTPGDFMTEKNNDDIAYDAHWGAGVVYDYWLQNHDRKSYDNLGADILSYVHIGVGYDNAFWNGSVMSYGDGMNFAPLTSLDVCGHEIGHAICSNTSDLVYALESGAMNEGFSDIWAACVEYYAVVNIDPDLATMDNPQIPFGIGEQIASPGTALRWMDNPKLENNPDTHGGEHWQNVDGCDPSLANDQCGVHGNSGVLNKWFYLLTVGSGTGSGPNAAYAGTGANADDEVNDNGDAYAVTGLGFAISEKIAFGTEVLLSATATFEEARTASIAYVKLQYGACGPEMESTLNAWNAVGVGPVFECDAVNGFFTNESEIKEIGNSQGCLAQQIHSIPLSIIGDVTDVPVTITGGTAEESVDFDLVTTSISGTGTFLIDVIIYDDAFIESDETIEIDVHNVKHTVTIIDNDIIPQIGGQTVNLLEHTFTSDDESSSDWSVFDAFPNVQLNGWYFDENLGGAYVSFNGIAPSYDGNGDELIYLVSPEIDATGLKEITFTSNIQYGGEVDADGTTPLDYGAFAYTFDGVTFTEFPDQRYGTAAQASANPTFTLDSSFDDKKFRIAFQWYNDALVNGAYSFAVEDILMTAKTKSVETSISNSQNKIDIDESEVYFFSDDGLDIVIKMDNVSEDISCVDVGVIASGNGRNALYQGFRSNKVIEITGMPEDASYDLTLYYTASELSAGDWNTSRPSLNILKVEGSDIDDLSNGFTVEQNPGYGVGPGSLYFEYTGTFTGNGVYAITDIEAMQIEIKALLQGPYNSVNDKMNDNLRTKNLIPLQEPYTTLGAFTHSGEGTETTLEDTSILDNESDDNDVVDWIFVELRNTSDVVITTQSGLIQRDGDIVSTDNDSPLTFYGVQEGDYHVVVRHRNHLGVKSSTTVNMNSTTVATYDFTTSASQAVGDQQIELIPGVFGIYAGNANGGSAISTAYKGIRMTGPSSINDALSILNHLNGDYTSTQFNIYSEGDINMDGNIRMTGPSSINDALILLSVLDGIYTNNITRSF